MGANLFLMISNDCCSPDRAKSLRPTDRAVGSKQRESLDQCCSSDDAIRWILRISRWQSNRPPEDAAGRHRVHSFVAVSTNQRRVHHHFMECCPYGRANASVSFVFVRLPVFDFSGNGSEARAGLSYGFEVEFTPNRD